MRLIKLLLILSLTPLASFAQYLSPYDGLTVVGTKAYRVIDLADGTGVQTIEQYGFPDLILQNSLSVTPINAESYGSSMVADENGVLVSFSEYDTNYTDNDDGSVTVTSITTTTNKSYDLNLVSVAEKVIETTTTYTSFPYLLGEDYNCPDNAAAKQAAQRVLARKKGGGKKGGNKVSCSKLRILKQRIIK